MSAAPVTQTDSDSATTESEIYEVPRKNERNRLHGWRIGEAEIHPRAEAAQHCSACCELYTHPGCRYLPLAGLSGQLYQTKIVSLGLTPQNSER